MNVRFRLSKRVLLIGRVVATVSIAAYIYRRFNWSGMWGVLHAAKMAPLACALFIQGFSIVVASARWRALLAEQGILVRWLLVLRLSFIGLFFNLLIPGSIGGDASRYLAIVDHDRGRNRRLALSLLHDRIMGLGGLLLVLCLFLLLHSSVYFDGGRLRGVAIGASCASIVFFTLAAVAWLAEPGSRIEATEVSANWMVRTRRIFCAAFPRDAFLPALALSVANYLLYIAAGFLVAHALGIPITYATAAIVFCVTALVLSLPITIAGLGVRDGMFIWLLATYGFKDSIAAAGLSLSMLGISLAWAAVGGLLFYYPNRS